MGRTKKGIEKAREFQKVLILVLMEYGQDHINPQHAGAIVVLILVLMEYGQDEYMNLPFWKKWLS